jgi:hypothetical protein
MKLMKHDTIYKSTAENISLQKLRLKALKYPVIQSNRGPQIADIWFRKLTVAKSTTDCSSFILSETKVVIKLLIHFKYVNLVP